MTRNEGLMNLTLPTGTQYQIVPTDYNPSIYVIKKKDSGSGALVAELAGSFTSPKQAMKPLARHINEVWDRFEASKAKKTA